MMTRQYFRFTLCCIAVGMATTIIHAQTAGTNDKPKVWTSDEMKWEKDATLPSVQSVKLWGDPAAGDHGMLRKFPAGYAPPKHQHPSVERVLVISGTMVVQYSGGQTKTLGPGSYSEIPRNTDHAVQCGKESDCVFLLTSSGPFAILPSSGNDQH